MRSLWILIALVIVSLSVAVVLYATHKVQKKIAGEWVTLQANEVNKVVLTNSSDEFVLEQKNEQWTLNNSAEVRMDLVLRMLATLEKMKVKAPVAKAQRDSLRNVIAQHGVWIEVFENGVARSKFGIQGVGQDRASSYIILDTMVYTVYIPGFPEPPSVSFPVSEFVWRKNVLFSYTPADIQSISLIYRDSPENSFTITHATSGAFSLSDNQNQPINETLDTSACIRYLSYLAFVPYERNVASGELNTDSLLATKPLHRIVITDKNQDSTIVYTYDKPADDNSGTIDRFRVLARAEGTNTVFIVRYMDIDPVLKKRSAFLKIIH